MPKFTFVKDRTEFSNVEGCRFMGDTFQTDDVSIANRLRNSGTFGKSVREITEELETKSEWLDLLEKAKALGINTHRKNKEALLAEIAEIEGT